MTWSSMWKLRRSGPCAVSGCETSWEPHGSQSEREEEWVKIMTNKQTDFLPYLKSLELLQLGLVVLQPGGLQMVMDDSSHQPQPPCPTVKADGSSCP